MPSGGEPPADESQVLHATTVAFESRGLLIRGQAGSGKSSLALRLIALGAALVSDDRTLLRRNGNVLYACAPEAIDGLIEARGVGLLRVPSAGTVPVAAVVDLDLSETHRLPPHHETRLMDVALPLLHNADSSAWPMALRLYLSGGRQDSG